MRLSNCYLKFLFFILLSLVISSCGKKIDGVKVSETQERGYLWLISEDDEKTLNNIELYSVSDIPKDSEVWDNVFFEAFPNISAVKYVIRNKLSRQLYDYYVYFHDEQIVGVDGFPPQYRINRSSDDELYLRLILRKGWQ